MKHKKTLKYYIIFLFLLEDKDELFKLAVDILELLKYVIN